MDVTGAGEGEAEAEEERGLAGGQGGEEAGRRAMWLTPLMCLMCSDAGRVTEQTRQVTDAGRWV